MLSTFVHLVVELSFGHPARIIRLKLIGNRDIQISFLLIVRLACKTSCDLFILLYRKDFPKVEDCLLPVCVFTVGASGELNRLVTSCEFNIEPGDERMDKILGSSDFECEGCFECKIGRTDVVEIDDKDTCRISNACLDLHRIDEWFAQSSILERRIVKAINVIPNYIRLAMLIMYLKVKRTSNLLILVFTILDASHIDRRLVRKYEAFGCQVIVSSV